MDTKKEYLIKEIKKCNQTKGRIYAFMSIIPATVLGSLAVATTAVQTNDPLIQSAAIIAPIASLLIDHKVMERYEMPQTKTSPNGPDDWSQDIPSLKEQLKNAKERLILLNAELINDNKKERR